MDPAAPGNPLSRQCLQQPAPSRGEDTAYGVMCQPPWAGLGSSGSSAHGEVVGDMGSTLGSPKPAIGLPLQGHQVPQLQNEGRC